MGATSQIQRISTGLLNTVQDTVIGGTTNSLGTGSATEGQLGKKITFDQEAIATAFDATVSNCYPGDYQYVLLDDGDPDSPALVAGDLVYFNGAAPSDFQVTASVDAGDEAGYVITPGWAPGTYGYIYCYGQPESFLPTPVV